MQWRLLMWAKVTLGEPQRGLLGHQGFPQVSMHREAMSCLPSPVACWVLRVAPVYTVAREGHCSYEGQRVPRTVASLASCDHYSPRPAAE